MGSFWTRSLGECANANGGGHVGYKCQWPYEGRMCSLLCQSDECRTKNPLVAISATKEKSKN